jgi:hypothetical protein
VLDHFAAECTLAWQDRWSTEPSRCRLPHSSAETEAAARLLRYGFASVLRVAHGIDAGETSLVAISPESDSPQDVIARARRAFNALGGARALVLTPQLWRAAALFAPSPFLAGSVAANHYEAFGKELPPPPAPPPEELMNLLRVRVVELFYRMRGRHLRLTKADARARFDGDLRLAPVLARALRGEMLASPGAQSPLVDSHADEATQIAALRRWIAEQKRVLTPELERRRVA